MPRPLLNQYNMLALFDRDRSSWLDVDHYPGTVTCRRMLRFADWASRYPQNYAAALKCYLLPELSLREIAVIMQLPYSTFRTRIAETTVIDDADDYSDIELDYNDVQAPTVPSAPEIRGTSETFRNAVAIADFASDNALRWSVIRSYYGADTTSQQELADTYCISQATVSRYLESISNINQIKEINNEYL